MRVLSVSELKREHIKTVRNDYPAEGSVAFQILTRLKSDPGHAVDLSDFRKIHSHGAFSTYISQLVDMYGMDIRSTKPKSSKLILAGEWIGSHYTDYCAAAFNAGSK